MYINFRQGIVSHPATNNLQTFLISSGTYVTLSTANGHTDVAFAHGVDNYLLTESATVSNAWGPLPASTDCWLYWDIDGQDAIRTFGFTLVEPVYGPTAPPSPVNDLHWFDTSTNVMYVYDVVAFREVIRVFAAKFNDSVFTPLAYDSASHPFSGSQVGLSSVPTMVGKILIDDVGGPIRRTNGHFFTTEHDIFVNGSPVNILRLESVILTGTATNENLHAYQVVKFSEFGEIYHAEYNDIQNAAVAMLLQDLPRHETGTVCLQGHVINPEWSWTHVGAPLWIDNTGALIETDPHVTNPQTFPIGKSPVARVITPTSVMFDQGLGGKGDNGAPGGGASKATDVVFGITRLSVAASDANDPIVAGTNDPRMSDARVPLAHTQAATTIIPSAYGGLTGANLQLVLQQIEDGKVSVAGDTMTGFLTLNADPTTDLQAATKHYVDSQTVDLSSRVAKAGDTMSGFLTLNADPTLDMQAATKQYVDARVQTLQPGAVYEALTTVSTGVIGWNNRDELVTIAVTG